MKASLRPFEYMRWAQAVPLGARYDLTASGMADTVTGTDQHPPWNQTMAFADHARRDVVRAAHDQLIATIADRYRTEPWSVIPTVGASLAITHTMMAFVRPGDHVVVERPTYEALYRVPEILGANVSRLERKFGEGWDVVTERLAKLLTPRTRAVVLSNLHNPSGIGVDADDLATIADLAGRVGATVLVDEVYLDYLWEPGTDARFRPSCVIADNTVSWSSVTKAFGFGALRVGWIVTRSPEAARALRAASDFLHVALPAASARMATAVLGEAPGLTAHAREIATRGRRILERWIDSEPRIGWVPPSGGICCALRLPSFVQDVTFCEHLRNQYDTQVVPGSMFEAPRFVRVGFGLPPKELEQGLANFSAALDDLT